jgi:molybdopterin converting factor small subunit
VEMLFNELCTTYPGLIPWREAMLVAVNCEYQPWHAEIPAGAEVAWMPPVQGG